MFRRLVPGLGRCLAPVLGLCLVFVPAAPRAQALSDALSTQGALTRLDTGDQGRGWEAVGRLDIDGKGFCTGALIASDLVLTAAHCLYDRRTGTRIAPDRIEFLAGFRNGRAAAYRSVRRAVTHSDYRYAETVSADRVRRDVALLELDMPIRNTQVIPFATDARPGPGDRIGVVSYARDRAEAPSLQEICDVMGRQDGMLVMSCDVDFGASGSPVFAFDGGQPRIVSVVSAKAEVGGARVALGADLAPTLDSLRAALDAGGGYGLDAAPGEARIRVGGGRETSGAKFVRAAN